VSPNNKKIEKRAGGLLLHVSSLPSKYGIGDLGPDAYKFVDFLVRAGQSYWQMLPLTLPTLKINPYSPYNCISAFAGNTLLISPDFLYRDNLLTKEQLLKCPRLDDSRIDFPKVISYKHKLFNYAYQHFKNSRPADYDKFISDNCEWLDDFALFSALRNHFKRKLWCGWPAKLRDRNKAALKDVKNIFQDNISKEKFLQYIFFKQFAALKGYCSQKNIKLIGDIPIYVSLDSADVWSHPEIFKLTKNKRPRFISGVPPDYFSKTGQLWGNPIYDWNKLKKTRYDWWLRRISQNLTIFDVLRIDHFRGFFAYWQVPAGAKTAKGGKWVKCSYEDFFKILFKQFDRRRLIAEDLGLITDDVISFIKKHHLTGMRVLQFGFDDPAQNPHFPANHEKNTIVYTGTHDNNTAAGWFTKDALPQQKKILFNCLGRKVRANQFNWEFIKLALSSPANLAIIPVQDLLGLNHSARMNLPGTTKKNWLWKLKIGQLTTQIAKKLSKLSKIARRNGGQYGHFEHKN